MGKKRDRFSQLHSQGYRMLQMLPNRKSHMKGLKKPYDPVYVKLSYIGGQMRIVNKSIPSERNQLSRSIMTWKEDTSMLWNNKIIPVCSFLLMIFFLFMTFMTVTWWLLVIYHIHRFIDAWYELWWRLKPPNKPPPHNPWRINFERCFPIRHVAFVPGWQSPTVDCLM